MTDSFFAGLLHRALETISINEEETLIDRARVNGDYFLNRLRELQEKHEWIGDDRGRELAIGVELVEDRVIKAPAAEKTAAVDQYRRRDRPGCGHIGSGLH